MSGATTLAIRYGTLHANDGEPRRNGTLVVSGGAIADVAADAAPEGARVLEAPCVIPGLVNAHVHLEMSGEAQTLPAIVLTTPTQRMLTCAENARKALHSGVTTVRDLGATENLAVDLRDAIAAGRHQGPTILAAARAICMTGGHGWWIGREADGPLDVLKAVREQRRSGADCIKFIATGGVLTKGAVPGVSQLLEDELRAGIEEAHRHDMRCAAHAIGTEGIKNALRAGIDSIEHGHLLDDEAIALFRERGAYLVPTLAAIACIVEAGPESGQPDYVVRKAREIAEHAWTNLTKARRAGVTFAGGADSGTPFNYHDNYAYEIELMQSRIGMSPREALAAATATSADLLGVDRGRIAAGKVADLVLLAADLESDARPLRDPLAVVKSGAIAFERR